MQKASNDVRMTSNILKMIVFLYQVLRISTSFSDLKEISKLLDFSNGSLPFRDVKRGQTGVASWQATEISKYFVIRDSIVLQFQY